MVETRQREVRRSVTPRFLRQAMGDQLPHGREVHLAQALDTSAVRIARLIGHEREFKANVSHQLRTPLTGLQHRLAELATLSDSDEIALEVDRAADQTSLAGGTFPVTRGRALDDTPHARHSQRSCATDWSGILH